MNEALDYLDTADTLDLQELAALLDLPAHTIETVLPEGDNHAR